ncbi:organic solvent tolerance protein OstA [Treponema parvum]|uniref:Organic solvent tolerance protein OstA n=2 Tax=Treponema parvum TaxID=138851 RepID=A0A975F6B9_9SPIR|nr:organic solvent tolerance protein OstA [Treponema parvum]
MKNFITENFTKAIKFLFLAIILSPAFSDVITFRADGMTGSTGGKNDRTNLEGHAFVKTDSMEIAADKIGISGDNFRYIQAEGNIFVKNTKTEMDFTCGRLSYDRETKIAVLDTDVNLTDTKNGVSAKAQMVEYNQNTETAVLQINIELRQKDNVCTGAYAIYHKNEQLLEISGSPKIVQGDDIFRAQEISLKLDTQEITMSGRVQGSITSASKNDKSENEPDADTNTAAQEDAATTKGVAAAMTTGTDDPNAAHDDDPKSAVQNEKSNRNVGGGSLKKNAASNGRAPLSGSEQGAYNGKNEAKESLHDSSPAPAKGGSRAKK